MRNFLEAMALALIALLAPIKGVLITIMVISIVDLVSGLLAARKEGQKLTSRGLKSTVIKVLVYQVAVLCAYIIQTQLLFDSIPIVEWLGSYIGLVELKSILENLERIQGQSVFKALTKRIKRSLDRD